MASRWTYRLFNDRGLSIRADIYRNGRFAGWSSKPGNYSTEWLAKQAALFCISMEWADRFNG